MEKYTLRNKIQDIWKERGGCPVFEPSNCDFCEKIQETIDLIDTVLGEEKKCYYKKHIHKTSNELFSCPCCVRNLEQEDVIRVDSQPLTEGEEKVTTSNKLDWCIRCDYNHSTVFKESCKCLCECHKPQESNKDEENKNNLAKYHDLDCSINPCYCSAKYHQEPSKKPSDRIKEIYKEGNPWIDCIIEYLDELHNQRNI